MAFVPSEDVAQPGHLMDRTALSQCVFVLSQCGLQYEVCLLSSPR